MTIKLKLQQTKHTCTCQRIEFVAFHVVLQLISFKDGKFGVNFAGYHAEAGLGGLLTGNAAHGGLSASAGTPFGNYTAIIEIEKAVMNEAIKIPQQIISNSFVCHKKIRLSSIVIEFLFSSFYEGQKAGAGIGGSVDEGISVKMP